MTCNKKKTMSRRSEGKVIYIAGPYTSDPEGNTLIAIQSADELVKMGYIPFIPHLSHYWHNHSPKDYQFWMEYDRVWLEKCDALVRLLGESPGADQEVEWATEIGLPVYYGLDQLP